MRRNFFFSSASTSHQHFSELTASEPATRDEEEINNTPDLDIASGSGMSLLSCLSPCQQDKAIQCKVPHRSVKVMTDEIKTANKSTNTGTTPLVLMNAPSEVEKEEQIYSSSGSFNFINFLISRDTVHIFIISNT